VRAKADIPSRARNTLDRLCDIRRSAHRRPAGEVPVPRVSDLLRPKL